jgi:hypothetical protein
MCRELETDKIKFLDGYQHKEEPGYLSGTALGYGLDDRRFESR